MKIYYKHTKRPKTVRELLNDFYQVNTTNKYSCLTPKATYSEKQCIYLQCSSGRQRSLTDLHILCKTYFPNVSLKKVFFELLLLKAQSSNPDFITCLICGYCYGINKMKFAKRSVSKEMYDHRIINFIKSSNHNHQNAAKYLSTKMFGKQISDKDLLNELSKYKKKYP